MLEAALVQLVQVHVMRLSEGSGSAGKALQYAEQA